MNLDIVMFLIGWYAIGVLIMGFGFAIIRYRFPILGTPQSDWQFAFTLALFGPCMFPVIFADIVVFNKCKIPGWYTIKFNRKQQ